MESSELITDQTITTLLSTEHAEPDHPHTTLPNLTHLNLRSSGITCEGLIELSQSQLFSQLEELDLSYCDAVPWNGNDQQLPPGLFALFTNSHLSNLESLCLMSLIPFYIEWEELEANYDILKHLQHLSNYCRIVY